MKVSLTGEWQFRALSETQYRQAVVPGCQFLDLMRVGAIPDPFVGDNERAVQWVNEADFVYRKVFDLPFSATQSPYATLVCKQLDTLCRLQLNGHVIGEADNCHRAQVFDVKPYIQSGQNQLEITFFSAKKYVEKRYRQSPTPPNSNGQNGIVYIRKPQYHFGWDWGPVLTPAGIGGDIYIDLFDAPHLALPHIETYPTSGGYRVVVRAEGAHRICLIYPDGTRNTRTGDSADFLVENPRLWWTCELSGSRRQPLYIVEAQILDGDVVLDSVRRTVGLRTITLNRQKDSYGYNFQFVLNGVPLFVKGADYIPPDCFITRFGEDRLEAMLDAVQYAQMNMLRIWGGGYYADDALLDACDRRGILVWQDCMFACQAYPFFIQDFRQNVLDEIEYNVRRMAAHPCLALWCGNNEIEAMHLAWAAMRPYVQWTEQFFYHILPRHIAAFDSQTPYIPGSPHGTAHNCDVDADQVGDTHLWGVWHGLQPLSHYRRRLTRFCSEFGLESLPSMRTVAYYATPEQYALRSRVQRQHQKCAGGNDKMLFYIASRFRLNNDIEDLVYLSQIVQQACIADATEHWRRNKGQCNGAIYWQLNDCWPTCSWSGYDYLGQYKALQYTIGRSNAPLAVSIQDAPRCIAIYVLNDYAQQQQVEVEYIEFAFDRILHSHRMALTVPACANAVAYQTDTAHLATHTEGIAVRLYAQGRCLMQKTHLLRPEKKLRLPQGTIEISQQKIDGRLQITLHSAVYQRYVMLQNDGEQPFSDNFFDLLPGETKVVWQAEGATQPVKLKTVATLRRPVWGKTVWARIKVFLSARNIAAALYHGRIPPPPKDMS